MPSHESAAATALATPPDASCVFEKTPTGICGFHEIPVGRVPAPLEALPARYGMRDEALAVVDRMEEPPPGLGGEPAAASHG